MNMIIHIVAKYAITIAISVMFSLHVSAKNYGGD